MAPSSVLSYGLTVVFVGMGGSSQPADEGEIKLNTSLVLYILCMYHYTLHYFKFCGALNTKTISSYNPHCVVSIVA